MLAVSLFPLSKTIEEVENIQNPTVPELKEANNHKSLLGKSLKSRVSAPAMIPHSITTK